MAAKSGKGKRKTTRAAKGKKPEQSFIKKEIVIWATLAACIYLVISNFGMGGFIGDIISGLLMDVFGWTAYIIPFALFACVSFIITNKGSFAAYFKTTAGVVLLVLLGMLFELIREAGGLFGALLVAGLKPAVGLAGTYVIVIVLMIICVVIITGKSALKGVKKHSDKAYDTARREAQKRKERSEERRAQRVSEKARALDGKRLNRKVEGVSFDTTLAKKSPEMKELTAPPEKENPRMEPSEPQFVINRSEPQKNDINDIKNMESDEDIPADVESMPLPAGVSVGKAKLSAADTVDETQAVASQVKEAESKPKKEYKLPPLSLLTKGKRNSGESDASLRETAIKLQQTLQNFGVNVTVTNVSCGPSVTRYELQPEMGVKVSKIVGLSDDIKLNLAAADIRIEAPIPGKAAVGIEVPNKENSAVMLRDLLETAEFKNSASKLSFAAGKDIGGKTVVTDIAKMPHLLVAGATGSGKSVCINTLIMSILYKATPEEVKLIMVDPKVVELSVYNGIPHLMIPVVTDPKKASGALNWAVVEMERRYKAFAEYNVRDMKGYNDKVGDMPEIDGKKPVKMPQIVIIVDELADLMMVAPGEVEGAICRLAQLARAAGIHLVVATQRPSVNVITGLIKANMPSRIAFSVSSGVDSRTIIDMNGAEKLLGKGDMLFYPSGYQKPARVQGAFVSDKEVQSVVEYLKKSSGEVSYSEEIESHVNNNVPGTASTAGVSDDDGRDTYFVEAGRLIIDKDKASIGMLQRMFKIGFNRAARIMDQLCEAGVVGGEEGTKPRKILMSPEEFEQYIEENA